MRKTQMSKKQKSAVVAATVAGLVGSGVAFAYWTTSGSGSGTATTSSGATNVLRVDQTSTNANMYPGDSAQTVKYTVTNTGTESYRAQAVKGYLTVVQAAGAPTGTCDYTDYKLAGSSTATQAAPVDLGFAAEELAGGATGATNSTTIQFNDKSTNQDPCKGATVTIHYVAS